MKQEGSLHGRGDTYQCILALQVISLGVCNYLFFFFLVVVFIAVSFIPALPRAQPLLLPPLILLRLPLPLDHSAVGRCHGRILRQRSRKIRKDKLLLLVPLSQISVKRSGVRLKKKHEERKLTKTMYPSFGHIGGCPGTGYTKSRMAPASSYGGSIASLMRCTTSEGERVMRTSLQWMYPLILQPSCKVQ